MYGSSIDMETKRRRLSPPSLRDARSAKSVSASGVGTGHSESEVSAIANEQSQNCEYQTRVFNRTATASLPGRTVREQQRMIAKILKIPFNALRKSAAFRLGAELGMVVPRELRSLEIATVIRTALRTIDCWKHQ